ncbi:hypothetical protein HK096_000878, partial [Nowakowskiella sp. JEL0078]
MNVKQIEEKEIEVSQHDFQNEAIVYEKNWKLYHEDICSLQNEYNTLEEEIIENKNEKNQLNEKIGQITHEKTVLESIITELRTAIAVLTEEAVATTMEKKNLEREKEKFKQASTQLCDLKENIFQKENIINELHEKISEMQNRIKKTPMAALKNDNLQEQLPRLRRVADAAQKKFAVAAQENLDMRLEIENLQNGLETLRNASENAWDENVTLRSENTALRERQRALENHRNEVIKEMTDRVERSERSAKSTADASKLLREQIQRLKESLEKDVGKGNKKTEKIVANLKIDLEELKKQLCDKNQEVLNLTNTLNELSNSKKKLELETSVIKDENHRIIEKLRELTRESAILRETIAALTRPKSVLE